MHLFTSWYPEGSSKQQNNSTAGEVVIVQMRIVKNNSDL